MGRDRKGEGRIRGQRGGKERRWEGQERKRKVGREQEKEEEVWEEGGTEEEVFIK